MLLSLEVMMFNLKMVVASFVVAILPPLGLTMVQSNLEYQAQERTEEASASVLREAVQKAHAEVEVAVVLGCYTKHCTLTKPGFAKVLTTRGVEKWQIEHGKPGEASVVKSGFKVVRCHCNQSECLVRKDGKIWIEYKELKGFIVFEVSK